MTPYLQDPDFTLYLGDVREVLRDLPDESVQGVVTSPPFWALRDYNVAGQIGLELTVTEWAAALAAVFEDVRRVLRADGSCLIEIGDSYVSGQGGRQSAVGELPPIARSDRTEPRVREDVDVSSWSTRQVATRVYPARATRLKPKDLVGQPFELAFALRDAGWWLRGIYPWLKVNAMPESATDRCTTAHSYLLHVTRSPRYFWNRAAIAEPAAWDRWGDQTTTKYEGSDTKSGWMQPKTKDELRDIKTKKPDGWDTGAGGHGSIHREGREKGETTYLNPGNRATNGPRGRTSERRGFDTRLELTEKNARSVWEIPTEGNSLALCAVCGAFWETGAPADRKHCGQPLIEHYAAFARKFAARCILAVSRPGDVVLDPFMGSGTTALVARALGRRCIGVELNPHYAAMAAKRLSQLSLLAEDVA